GMLESAETSLGTMRMRAGFQSFPVFPQSGAYLGPVVVLIDEMSASTTEIFASGMQSLGRAKVVGTRSAGAALPSILEKLPTGAIFQYAIGDFRTPKGALIEGRGVTPDIEVNLSREALLSGTDPQIKAAIKAIDDLKGNQRVKAAGAFPGTARILRALGNRGHQNSASGRPIRTFPGTARILRAFLRNRGHQNSASGRPIRAFPGTARILRAFLGNRRHQNSASGRPLGPEVS